MLVLMVACIISCRLFISRLCGKSASCCSSTSVLLDCALYKRLFFSGAIKILPEVAPAFCKALMLSLNNRRVSYHTCIFSFTQFMFKERVVAVIPVCSCAGCKMPNSEQAPEECDATGFHSSNTAWPIKNIFLYVMQMFSTMLLCLSIY
jgi:hypothetical protein